MELERSVTLITTIHHVNQEYGSEEELLFILAHVHTQEKVEQNCTFWYTIGCSLAGTQISTIWYSFLASQFLYPCLLYFQKHYYVPQVIKKIQLFHFRHFITGFLPLCEGLFTPESGTVKFMLLT